MHQEHNIPWNKVASHFKFVRDHPRYTPRRTGLFFRELQTRDQDFGHFTRVFLRTIATFSTTERAKFASSFDPLLSGQLFSDELCRRHPDYLDSKNQHVETWITRASAYTDMANQNPYYNYRDGDLADIVKILIAESEMSTLLMLAHHPQVPLSCLSHVHLGIIFGFARVAEFAIELYVFVNIADAMGILHSGEYLELPRYADMVCKLTMPMDYSAEQLPHRHFLSGFPKDPTTSLPMLHQDLPRLRDYLKAVFRLMYQCDLLLRECGINPKWENEIAWLLRRRLPAFRL